MAPDGGGCAHFLGNREGGLEEVIEHGAQTVGVAGHFFGLFHLADDLRFAEHHGVEAGGHSEGVLGGLFLHEGVDVRLKFRAADVFAFANEAEHGVPGGVRVFDGAVDFGAVAGGTEWRPRECRPSACWRTGSRMWPMVSAISSGPKATRSRTETGAVVWFRPIARRCIASGMKRGGNEKSCNNV